MSLNGSKIAKFTTSKMHKTANVPVKICHFKVACVSPGKGCKPKASHGGTSKEGGVCCLGGTCALYTYVN